MIGFNPVIHPATFRAPFTANEGWGTFSQGLTKKQMKAELSVNWGFVSLKTIYLNPRDLKGEQVKIAFNGQQLNATLVKNRNGILVELEAPVSIAAGQSLTVEYR